MGVGRDKRSVERVSQEETVSCEKKMFVPALQASGRALTGIISELERTAGGAGRQTLGSDLNLRK